MNTRSLRFQLLVWYTSLIVVAFALVGLLIWGGLNQVLLQNLRDLLARRARQISHGCSQSGVGLNADSLRAQISALYAPETPESNGRFVRVTRANGNVLFRSGMPADGSFDPDTIPLDLRREEGFWIHEADSEQIVIRTVRTVSPGGELVIEVGGSTTPVKESVRHLLIALGFAAPVLVIIAAGGAYFLIGRALKPVVTLAESAETITINNLPERLPVARTGDELETLSMALNRMINRIHSAVETNRQFIADASHELRTPLAILQADMESATADQAAPPAARERAGSHLEEIERLSKVVQSLLALARYDCGEAAMDFAVIDISRVAANTAEQMALLAEDKRIALKCETDSAVFAKADPARIKQVVVNLLDNAIKYTRPEGKVRIVTRMDGDKPTLEVIDNGIGIPAESIPLVFDRFYRVDKGRSRDLGGAGLGLSIVKAICAAHRAELSVESNPGLGSLFRVQFPRLRREEASLSHNRERRPTDQPLGK